MMMIMMLMMMMMMDMMQTCSALLAAVCWILRGGAGNSLDHGQLHAELLQLGTPRWLAPSSRSSSSYHQS